LQERCGDLLWGSIVNYASRAQRAVAKGIDLDGDCPLSILHCFTGRDSPGFACEIIRGQCACESPADA
jgi:hypothetical protein